MSFQGLKVPKYKSSRVSRLVIVILVLGRYLLQFHYLDLWGAGCART